MCPFPGRGVFTRENIKPSAFVVEYRGKIFSQGPISEKGQNTLKGFILKYPWKGEQWWYVFLFVFSLNEKF